MERQGEIDYDPDDDFGRRLGRWFTWKFTAIVIVLTAVAAGPTIASGEGGLFTVFGAFIGASLLASVGKKVYINQAS